MTITRQGGSDLFEITGGNEMLTNTNIGNVVLENATYIVGSSSRLRFGNAGTAANPITFRKCKFIDHPDSWTYRWNINRWTDGDWVFEDCEWWIHPTGRGDVDSHNNATVTFRNCTINYLATTNAFHHLRRGLTFENTTFTYPYATTSIEMSPLIFVKGNGRNNSFTLKPRDPDDTANRQFLLFDGSAAAANTTYRITDLVSPNAVMWASASTAVLELIDPVNTNGTTRVVKTQSSNGILQGWRTININMKELGDRTYNMRVRPLDTGGRTMVGLGNPQSGDYVLENQTETTQSFYVKEYQVNHGTYDATETPRYQIRIRGYNLIGYDSGELDVDEKIDINIAFATDKNVTLSQNEARNLPGIQIDFVNEVITLTQERTISEIYDHWKALFVDTDMMNSTTMITWNGNLINLGNYTINGTEFIRT